jgi:hypothetical protein
LLPLYGLAGAFTGERLIEGEGADVGTLIHRPGGDSGELTVGVLRRATAALIRNAQPVLISAERARESVALALVVDLPGIGEGVFEKAAELAQDDDVWKSRHFEVDGELLTGYEVVHENMWVAYCLMPTVILYVLAPVALRAEIVKLRILSADEIPQRED